ncbi:MAG: SIR2 family protein [Succinivibrio sp.]
MDWNGCLSIMQGYLENSPLIVLGSGASMPYGLPSMNNLANCIISNPIVKNDPNYGKFCTSLRSDGLEKAIDSVSLNEETIKAIRTTTWEEVNRCDLDYLKTNSFSPPESLVKLFEKVIAPTPNKAVVVTTNYDRLPDYAADGIGASSVNGFEGSYIRKLELPNNSITTRRVRARERVVEIWKVHGSLDWFTDAKGEISAFQLLQEIPAGFSPLIVPPGKDKYSSTHNEPYRSIISEADKAFTTAGAYLCVGYGFNDEHIQPKLLAQIANGKPIVILVKKMTNACKHHIIDAGIRKYLIFESFKDSYTKVYGNGWSETYDGQYWCLNEFLKVW